MRKKKNSNIIHIALVICVILQCSYSVSSQLISGVVNSYFQVTNIPPMTCTGLPSTLEVADATGLAVGDTVLIIQMQGATSSITNDPTDPNFGTLLSLDGAGNNEFLCINAINGNSIKFTSAFFNNYNVNGKVQLVKIPSYVDATVDASGITSLPWNGVTGGIIAILAKQLTLNGNITASGLGFRGGKITHYPGVANFNKKNFYYHGTFENKLAGNKGEGVTVNSIFYQRGRGKIANGGGGGNGHNSGGAGGGLGGNGGNGGWQMGTDVNNENDVINGIGGEVLPQESLSKLVYLGGGGGEGHEDNEIGTSIGGNGGGIIIIKADSIFGNGFQIASNGGNGGNSYQDGAGGGGSGGFVNISANKVVSLSVSAKGGDGGTITNTEFCYGPGGGGGGGIIRTNIVTSTGFANSVKGGKAGYTTLDCGSFDYGIHLYAGDPYHAENGQDGKFIDNFSIILPPPLVSGLPGTPKVKDYAVCLFSNPISLTADGYNLLWYNNSIGGIGNPSAPIPTTTLEGTNFYFVTQTNEPGCESDRARVAVSIPFVPSPVTDNFKFCQYQDAKLLIASGTNLKWYNHLAGNILDNPLMQSTSISGIFSYDVTQTLNCESRKSLVIVTVVSYPIVIPKTNYSYCLNDISTALSASGSNLQWFANSVAGVGSATPLTPPTTIPGNFNFFITGNDGSICTATGIIKVAINPLPTLIGSNAEICPGQTALLTIAGAKTYSYQPPLNLRPSIDTEYTVTGTDLLGCKSSISQSITINPTPTISGDNAIGCYGKTAILTVTGSDSYQWSISNENKETLETPVLFNSELFSVVGISTKGCKSKSLALRVTVEEIKISVANKAIKTGESTLLTPTISGLLKPMKSVVWKPEATLESSNVLETKAKPTDTTTYELTIETENGCIASGNVTVTVYFPIAIPNIITPNGDNINDSFIISKGLPGNKSLKVYNRWGAEVYASDNYDNKWSPTDLSDGLYYYSLKHENEPNIFSGWVLLAK